MENPGVSSAAEVVRQGGVIAYPTEAVWGLGCDPWNCDAVLRVLDIKDRPVDKGVILIGSDEGQFSPLLDALSPDDRETVSKGWPGPYTWLIPDPHDWVPEWVKGQFATVAIRISAHPTVQALCRQIGHPIVSTSANRAGEPPLLTKSAVEQTFSEHLDAIVCGQIGGRSAPSEIRDLRTKQLIRAG